VDINRYNEWVVKAKEDNDLILELSQIKNNEKEIKERFYRDLEFGTGGLRGIIGAGTNRMNIYTLGKATQGYSNYLKKNFKNPSVAIAYDSRIKSELFAQTAAAVFGENGITVYIYNELMPTPALSFAIRYLKCNGGIVITASHNPGEYNGYKVYNADGCQITLEAAESIQAEINAVNVFNDVKKMKFHKGLSEGRIAYIGDEIVNQYLAAVSKEALQPHQIDKNVSIVYTPLNGAGRRCVTACLKQNGFENIIIPKEQENPEGTFPTCPYPNPEIREALEVGLKKAAEVNSDILLATDPDCDRVGVAIKMPLGFELISGNQMGILLFDYICKIKKATGTLPNKPIAITTIVSTKMADKVAKDYGVELRRVLTGFKYIGEQIGLLEEKDEVTRYIFGFEESYGYLSGAFVRDKDGVNASLLICEMFAYYKSLGKSLIDVINELYQKHGVFTEELQSVTFEGATGFEKMCAIMKQLREHIPKEMNGHLVDSVCDYKVSKQYFADGETAALSLPKSNVLEFNLEGDITAIVRPSGTEPKLKVYYSVKSKTKEEGKAIIDSFINYFNKIIGA